MGNRFMPVILLLLAAALVPVASQGTEQGGSTPAPDRIIISYPAGEDQVLQKYFDHRGHSGDYQVPCAECHHVFEEGKNVWQEGMPVQKCAECHEDQGSQEHENLAVGLLLKKMSSKITPFPACGRCHAAGSGD